ncbi:hypothetical protein PHET_10460 [Paragonimus heterotremus]|uniref:Uncharacterized protein n=1 Tax=Paragonimus heterotremus TaxID=100268 RepID=A0A8J4WE48_9TREM|nr:hypothetical protein PHET_10460 [Paragonimus heterotremus]
MLTNVTKYHGKKGGGLLRSFFHRIWRRSLRHHMLFIVFAAHTEHDCFTCTISPHLLSPKTSTNKTTQMGCDFAYTNSTVVPPIRILCFFNFP